MCVCMCVNLIPVKLPKPFLEGHMYLLFSTDMGCGHQDGTMQVIRQQPASLNTTRLVLNQLNVTDLVLHIGDISYARGFASVVSG